MKCTLTNAQTATVLEKLYADAEEQSARFQREAKPLHAEPTKMTPFERFSAAKNLYMPIDRPFGHLIVSAHPGQPPGHHRRVRHLVWHLDDLSRRRRAGQRHGQNHHDRVHLRKIDVARRNLTNAGLADLIEFRSGDAMRTLGEPLPGPVDFLFLDGEKSMYLDILRLLEPRMRTGCLVVSDNTDQAGAKSYLDYIRAADNGYVSSALLTTGGPKHQSGHEVSVRL